MERMSWWRGEVIQSRYHCPFIRRKVAYGAGMCRYVTASWRDKKNIVEELSREKVD